jgi:hypothetical protein
VFTAVTMKNTVFWDIKKSVRTSQETHYVSATESSRLMLCKSWDFHGGDYEECLLLEYKNPVRTSHEIHYFSTTMPSRLMFFTIWGLHGGDYEEERFQGCYAVWLSSYMNNIHNSIPLFKENIIMTTLWKRMWESMYRSKFSWPWNLLEVNGLLHATEALPLRKSLSVPNGYGVGWAPGSTWTTLKSENSLILGIRSLNPLLSSP